MSVIRTHAGRSFRLVRRTAFVLDPAKAAASMTPDRQPTTASLVEVRISGGTDNTGTVTVTGTVDGSPDSEVLTFTAAGRKRTVKRFSALTSIATSGLADEATVPSIEAKAVGADGSRHHVPYTVASGIRGHLERGRPRWRNTTAGTAETEPTWLAVEETSLFTPREGDAFVDEQNGQEWIVVGAPLWQGGLRAHHWECEVERREGTA